MAWYSPLTPLEIFKKWYTVIEVEGCEYFFSINDGACHKGNCKNPIHNRESGK